MPATPSTADMGRRHEESVAKRLGAHRVKASGATAHDKGDLAHHHDEPFAFRADCKSTKGASITVTLAMIQKLREQAGGERPLLPLRWYGNAALTQVLEDWAAVTLDDFEELLATAVQSAEWATKCAQALQERDDAREQAESWAELMRRLNVPNADPGEIAELVLSRRDMETALEKIGAENERLTAALEQANAWKDVQGHVRPGAAPDGPAVPGYVPVLPWTVVHSVHVAGTVKNSGVHYDEQGHQQTFDVAEVRVERDLGSSNRPRLIVNTVRVSQGALYVDGILRALVCKSNPQIEVG